ncbi:response regulator [Flaviaesturariibacter aridisoli]|uniref:Response regulator n=1 Tax=Flaviaesturariibacter aridisoli TaxID=2545761 RepID=A0A4R4E0C7_9BACT|nr:response regulator [Flaviaesturariibacter aridisoli]TCZ72819.1 response regulator [Flaviaesturariibacter aridisoli]
MTKTSTPKNIVLYADDDTDDLQLVQDAFSEFTSEVEVVTVSDGGQALHFLQGLNDLDPLPCLIILDVNMPIVDGKQVLRELRTMDRYADVPVVLFTTSSLPTDRSFAEKYKAGFITKPLHYRQMEQITDEFISHCAEEVRRKIQNKNS